MDHNREAPNTVDAYIAQFPSEIQAVMQAMRKAVREAAPEAGEKISWQMPTFTYHGNLVHFAGSKNHLGFYPGPSGVAHFLGELTEYKTSKGAIQFPYTKLLPLELIGRIVKYRMAENEKWAAEKAEKRRQT